MEDSLYRYPSLVAMENKISKPDVTASSENATYDDNWGWLAFQRLKANQPSSMSPFMIDAIPAS